VVEIVNEHELHKSSSCPNAGSSNALAWTAAIAALARDFERYARTVAAFVRLAMIRLMLDA